MATGTKGFKGLAVPLNGESQIQQITAADDILTITGASGQAGDFLVCENSSGTEKFYVDASGNIVTTGNISATGTLTVTGNRIKLGSALTTAPTTGLTKGDMFVIFGGTTATAPNIGVCVSTATQLIKYFGATTETLGRQT
jgi:hypothetical protein